MTDEKPQPASPFDEATLADIAQVVDQPNPQPEIVTRLVETLTEALPGPDAKLRWQAAITLGKIRDGRAVEALIKTMMSDAEAMIQMEATTALVNTAVADVSVQERVIDALLELLNTSPRTLVRRNIAQGLIVLKPPRAVEQLTVAMDDSDRKLAHLAIDALRAIGTPDAIALLKQRERDMYNSR